MRKRPLPMAPLMLLSGQTTLPPLPDARALLFLECVAHGILTWDALLAFHAQHGATPADWPRSFAETYDMLRLAVAMTDAFGHEHQCAAVTHTLMYHLFDRDPHPDLIALVQDALPQGVTLLLLTSTSDSPS